MGWSGIQVCVGQKEGPWGGRPGWGLTLGPMVGLWVHLVIENVFPEGPQVPSGKHHWVSWFPSL